MPQVGEGHHVYVCVLCMRVLVRVCMSKTYRLACMRAEIFFTLALSLSVSHVVVI